MAGGVNMDQYEAYFRRADLDGDGRISGPEAVTFFQGSNLTKNVLSQIWTYADQSKSGFLGRTEFYNALRLVTVAQSKRELTPDIVKAALYGPAAAKIPAPQINIPTTPLTTQGTSTPRMGMPTPQSSQNYGFRPQGFPIPDAAQQNFRPLQNQMLRPAQPTSTSSVPSPPQGIAGPEISRISSPGGLNVASDWVSGRTSMGPPGPRGITPPVASVASIPQTPVSAFSQPTGADSKALVPSGNGLPSNSGFTTEQFSATSSIPKQEPAGMNFPVSTPTSSARIPVSSGTKTKQNALDSFSLEPANSQFQHTQSVSLLQPTSGQTILGSTPTSSTIVPVSSGNQTSSKLNALDSLSAFSLQPTSGQFQPTQKQSLLSPGQQVPATTASNDSHTTWPKMKPSDIHKYANVFMKVDTDRDGKITGEQARNLFLSWRLPREVLKQVWDLSDQDNDGMLSLREFSFALYLMERYKEGRPLPPALPNNVLFDETLLSMTGQPKTVYTSPASGVASGFGQHQMMTGAQSMPPAAGQRPPFQGGSPGPDSQLQPNQQKPVTPVLENSFLMDNGKDNARNSGGQLPITAEKKVPETENMILDSKEKIEFYRTKMQELVLYKSRCDNRLNEITERASADKREAESLAKKYEEKYKQVAEIASKLTIEEAKFRDIQERKMEFQQAITKMEQGGSADGILQVRADRIQSDLDALIRALKERCSKHGINVKSTSVIELPTGWQPGASWVMAEWDEDWDKFEDEGFLNDLAIEGKKATTVQREENFIDDDSVHYSSPNAYLNKGELLSNGDHVSKSESVFNHSDDGLRRSPQDSPTGRSAFDSPVGKAAFDSPVGRAAFDSPEDPFRKGPGTDDETHRSFDESTWGAFDNNDDGDSVWGYNKDSDIEKPKDLFRSDDFRVSVVRAESPHGSPHGDSMFKAKSPFMFEDSVPGTPLSRFGNSPRYSEAGDHFFDNMSSFDSFSMHDDGFTAGPERLTRFDSINSSKDFGFGQDKFSRFDSISSSKDLGFGQDKFSRFDSISSSGDFGFGQDKFSRFDSVSHSRDFGYNNEKFSRSDSTSSSKDLGYNSEKFTRFDSMSSTRDFGHGHAFSFDEPDPFGSSGPFKVSSDNRTPDKNVDNWKAF